MASISSNSVTPRGPLSLTSIARTPAVHSATNATSPLTATASADPDVPMESSVYIHSGSLTSTASRPWASAATYTTSPSTATPSHQPTVASESRSATELGSVTSIDTSCPASAT